MTFTNETKHSTSFSNIGKSNVSNNETAGFDSAQFGLATFDAVLVTYTYDTKHSTNFTNLNKN